jgi:hypothetical protein
MMAGNYSPTTNYGTGQQVVPAGQGQTLGSTQQGSGTTFWSPSKYAMIVDARPVPGMTTFQGSSGVPQNFLQLFPGQQPTAPPTSVRDDPGYAGDPTAGPTPYDPNAGPTYTGPPLESGNTLTTGLGQAMNNLLQIGTAADPTAIQTIQDQLIKGGFLDPTKKGFNYGSISGTNDPTYSSYYQLLEQSIRTGTDYNAILQARISRDAGKKYEDALKLQQEKRARAQKLADAQLLPHTIDRTAVKLDDPLTAQNMLTTMLKNQLGRNPEPAEVSQFTQALTTAEKANPTNTVATTDPMSPYQDKTAISTGGFDPSQFTQNYIDQNFAGEKAAVGGATGFYQAALSTLGAGGRGY